MADTNENGNAQQSGSKLKSVESLDQTNAMERGLSNRHVQFIAIGGTIGTGLFLGSGKSISLTGPSIVFVYILVGVIMFFLMRAIGEMMYRDPSQHTFINFITRYLGCVAFAFSRRIPGNVALGGGEKYRAQEVPKPVS